VSPSSRVAVNTNSPFVGRGIPSGMPQAHDASGTHVASSAPGPVGALALALGMGGALALVIAVGCAVLAVSVPTLLALTAGAVADGKLETAGGGALAEGSVLPAELAPLDGITLAATEGIPVGGAVAIELDAEPSGGRLWEETPLAVVIAGSPGGLVLHADCASASATATGHSSAMVRCRVAFKGSPFRIRTVRRIPKSARSASLGARALR
jgi:hypothetical protein